MLELWYQALASPLGIVVQTSDRKLMSQKLYAERQSAGDPALSLISIRNSPYSDGEIWLVRKDVQRGT